jgi:hypothetical protein
MRPVTVDMVSVLETSEYGVFGETVFIGTEPESPVNTITLYDTGGEAPVGDDFGIDISNFQVRVRHSDYTAGYAVVKSIQEMYKGYMPTIIGESRYIGIWLIGNIVHLASIASREIWVANFKVMREAAET